METWSVKIDDDLKGKIQDIARSDFDNNQDFMQSLIYLYEMNKLKQDGSVLSGEVDEIQKLANRIINLFIHANDKTATLLEDKDKLLQTELVSKETTIKMLQDKLMDLEVKCNEFSDINDTLTESNKGYTEDLAELIKSKDTLQDLVSEYKAKNDKVLGDLLQYQGDHEENKELHKEVSNLSSQLHSLQLDFGNAHKEIDTLTDKLDKQELKHNEYIDELQAKHLDEIEHTKRNCEVDSNLSMLKLQQEYQQKLAATTEKHANDIETMSTKHSASIDSYQVKYKSLLEELEKKQDIIRDLESKLSAKKTK